MKYYFPLVGALSLLLTALIALVFVVSGEDTAKAHGCRYVPGYSHLLLSLNPQITPFDQLTNQYRSSATKNGWALLPFNKA